MDKYSGMHMYICITNYNEIITNDENENGNVVRSIHALDTFFSAIESYGKKLFPDVFVVEKITGARLHLYIIGELQESFEIVKSISSYAYIASTWINSDESKFRKLDEFVVNASADYGDFYVYEFETDGYDEITSIGYAANYAAKLQSVTETNMLSISSDVLLKVSPDEMLTFEKRKADKLTKYNDGVYYTASMKNIHPSRAISSQDEADFRTRVLSVNLSDINFTSVRKLLDFDSLSKTSCKELQGVPLFVDVREFTAKFYEDDSNLEEMKSQTEKILAEMYRITTSYGGVHVQFQGDRELSLFHNIPSGTNGEDMCYKHAVLAAMRLVDAMGLFGVSVGIGGDFGRVFATKIGARGEKDNILLGETLVSADKMEDCYARNNQIAITGELYKRLKLEDSYLASKFSRRGDYYIASVGFKKYMNEVSISALEENNRRKKYNPAWRY